MRISEIKQSFNSLSGLLLFVSEALFDPRGIENKSKKLPNRSDFVCQNNEDDDMGKRS